MFCGKCKCFAERKDEARRVAGLILLHIFVEGSVETLNLKVSL